MSNEILEQFIVKGKNNQWDYPDVIPLDLFGSDWPWAPIFPRENHDYLAMISELNKIDDMFVEHRANDKINSYGHDGWYSLTLHGISHDKTENFDRYGFTTEEEANYKWTEVCNKIPQVMKLIESLPFKNYGRVRIMRLSPRGYIMPHTDGAGRIFGPYNFAINNPPGCEFVFENYGVVPFEAGKGFLLDIGNTHAIYNNSDQYRYHIIIHGHLIARASDLVKEFL